MALRRRLVEPGKALARFAGVEQHLAQHGLRLGHALLGARPNERRPRLRRTGEAGGDFFRGKAVQRFDQNFTPSVAKAERPGAIDA